MLSNLLLKLKDLKEKETIIIEDNISKEEKDLLVEVLKEYEVHQKI